MKIGWVIIGILIAVGIFILFPGVFHTMVSWVQSLIRLIVSWIPHNATNITGG